LGVNEIVTAKQALITRVTERDRHSLAELVLGTATTASQDLDRSPAVSLEALVEMMANAEIDLAAKESGRASG
jgi:hypothetical protein